VCQRGVLLALLTTVLGFGGVFTVFTYIAPALEQVSGIAPHGVSSVLLLMGLGVTLGNSIGGRLADRALMPALTGILALLALALAAFAVALGSPVGAICIAVLWGAAGFATISPLQARVVQKAPQAPTFASSMNIAAFNLGNAGGAFLGGAVLDAGLGYRDVALAGSMVTLLGLLCAVLGRHLDRDAETVTVVS
jgi:DHA1 family inner membrane transport protein